MITAWKRVLQVKLKGKSGEINFGTNYLNGEDDLNIEVVGHKYMSALKDTCTIKISNLTYGEIVQIITGGFYDVEVTAGYQSSNKTISIFSGGILQITNRKDDRSTNTVIILCASQLVAKYGQTRLNLSLNSGINMYSAIKFICERAGIKNANISTQLKKKILTDTLCMNSNVQSWIEKLCSQNETYIVNSDSSIDSSSPLTLFDAAVSNKRVINLTSDKIILSGGYPKLTNSGVKFAVFPTFGFTCGDTIKIDNSILDLSTENFNSAADLSKGYYIDEGGKYMIFEIEFELQNRGPTFVMTLDCKARSLISGYTG